LIIGDHLSFLRFGFGLGDRLGRGRGQTGFLALLVDSFNRCGGFALRSRVGGGG